MHRQDLSAEEAVNHTILLLNQNLAVQVKVLLEEKHLYQKVKVDADALAIKTLDITAPMYRGHFERQWSQLSKWLSPTFDGQLYSGNVATGKQRPLLQLMFTNVRLFCSTCDRKEAFRPVWLADSVDDLRKKPSERVLRPASALPETFQLFSVLYQCQSCQGQPVAFLIRRNDWVFNLEGRSPIENIESPEFLPKPENKWYREAVIAFGAGKTLAGLFFLRTFIEQFARRVTSLEGKVAGSEIMDAYNATLPTEFKSAMPSLGEWYEKLSAAIHSANEDSTLYEEAKEQIYKHFDIRRVFNISENKPKVQASATADPAQ